MYKESEKVRQTDIWNDPSFGMGRRTREIFENSEGWHHRFRREVTNRVDESIFKPLYSEGKGAPNAPIRILVAMMALKEGQGISDEQLYEQARFNALIRSALGLINSDEEVPTESTYYLFRQKISEYAECTGANLLEAAFEGITKGQCQEYQVSGKRVRMDSKLLGSNIGIYSRYGVVHEMLRKYCAANGIKAEEVKDTVLSEVLKEKAETTTYRNTKEEVARRFEELGTIIYRLLAAGGAERHKEYVLLKRVFEEQYEVTCGPGGGKKKIVKPRKNGEISSKSVQSPHDEDSEYRNKGGHKVNGYSLNVVETCDKGNLNLIVDVRTEGAATADLDYFQEGINKAQTVVTNKVEEVYTDGVYHSPDNQEYCKQKGIEWVMRGIGGPTPKYDVSYDEEGNMVVYEIESRERIEVTKAKSRKSEGPQRWGIRDKNNKMKYFQKKDVVLCELRKRLEGIPKERLDIRNNVEATIFQVGYHYRSDKSSYRGLFKHGLWSISRCLWVNFRRIQLWCMRQAGNSVDDGEGSAEGNIVFIFFRWLLRGYRLFFGLPVLAGS